MILHATLLALTLPHTESLGKATFVHTGSSLLVLPSPSSYPQLSKPFAQALFFDLNLPIGVGPSLSLASRAQTRSTPPIQTLGFEAQARIGPIYSSLSTHPWAKSTQTERYDSISGTFDPERELNPVRIQRQRTSELIGSLHTGILGFKIKEYGLNGVYSLWTWDDHQIEELTTRTENRTLSRSPAWSLQALGPNWRGQFFWPQTWSNQSTLIRGDSSQTSPQTVPLGWGIMASWTVQNWTLQIESHPQSKGWPQRYLLAPLAVDMMWHSSPWFGRFGWRSVGSGNANSLRTAFPYRITWNQQRHIPILSAGIRTPGPLLLSWEIEFLPHTQTRIGLGHAW